MVLIPKPAHRAIQVSGSPKKHKSLQEQLGFNNPSDEFKKLCKTWHQVIQATLDTQRSFKEQSTQAKHKFCKQAMKSTPLLRDYADCWPATTYAYLFLKCKQSHPGQHPYYRQKKLQKVVTSVLAQPSPIRGPAIVGKSLLKDDFLIGFLNSLWIAQKSLKPLLLSLGIKTPCYLVTFTNLRCRDAWLEKMQTAKKLNFLQFINLREGLDKLTEASLLAADPPIVVSSLLTFLRHCFSPSLESLLPCFEQANIDTAGLTRPSHTINALRIFVEADEMTPLQFRMIEEGLEEIRRGRISIK